MWWGPGATAERGGEECGKLRRRCSACAVAVGRRPGWGGCPREVTWLLSNPEGARPAPREGVPLPVTQRRRSRLRLVRSPEGFSLLLAGGRLGAVPVARAAGRKRRLTERAWPEWRLWAGRVMMRSPAAANECVREASLNPRSERRMQSGEVAMRKRCGTGTGGWSGRDRDGGGGDRGRGTGTRDREGGRAAGWLLMSGGPRCPQ